jgi:tRNA-5-methyluridine54 2-sulfurtransferase
MKSDRETVRSFENKVKHTIQKYKLLTKKDRVIVACSGGKDSTAVLYILKNLGYKPEALMIDLEIGKWSDENLNNLKHNIEKIDPSIPLHIISPREIFGTSVCYLKSLAKQNAGISSCMICGVMKKHLLNKKARELGMTKIATGHNMDDEAQNLLLNMLKGNPEMCMNLGPITGTIKNSHFVDRIKPLYFTPEKDIRKYSEIMKFKLQYDRCPCSTDGYRKEIRNILNTLEKSSPGIKENLVNNLTRLKKDNRRTESTINLCESCGEPARNTKCRLCEILETIKNDQITSKK